MQQGLKSQFTKQIILDQSFKLFYQNGFKATSVDTVMKATKLTKGAFYHHYKNKQELGLAVIALKVQKRVLDGMVSPLKNSGNPIEILETTFSERLKSFSLHEKQHGCPMNNFINEIGDLETVYQTALKQIVDTWKAALIDIIERGKRENTIKKEVSSVAVATFLISGFEGVRGIRKVYDNDTILDEYIAGLSTYLQHIKA
jgi:AcrR family transcriptional regulator